MSGCLAGRPSLINLDFTLLVFHPDTDLISETKENFPEASLDILNELFHVGNAFNHSLLSVQRKFWSWNPNYLFSFFLFGMIPACIQTHQDSGLCRNMISEAEKKFWGCPELVDNLIPFMDVYSILRLTQVDTLSQIPNTPSQIISNAPSKRLSTPSPYPLLIPNWTSTPSTVFLRPTSLYWTSSWAKLSGPRWSVRSSERGKTGTAWIR